MAFAGDDEEDPRTDDQMDDQEVEPLTVISQLMVMKGRVRRSL